MGIDLFESRPTFDRTGLTLKAAYRTLHATGARIRLVPGDPVLAIGRIANEIPGVDLVIVSHGDHGPPLARLAPFLPRMLHADSRIFVEKRQGPNGGLAFEILRPEAVLALTRSVRTRRAA